MVNLARLIKHKRILLASALLVVVVISAFFFMTRDKGTDQPTSQPQAAETSEDPSKVAIAKESTKAPESVLPKECIYDAAVNKILGDNPTKTGRSSKTKNSNLIECIYRKNDKIVTIQRYEYQSEPDAQNDLSKVAPKGYVGQTKGKYNMVVSVVAPSGADISAADSLLKSSVQSL